MRRRSRPAALGQNVDSFLDMMTNTVGVLVFVLLFVALAAADASILVRTPLLTKTPKDGVLFEVRGDRVVHVDTDAVTADFQRFLRSLPEINLYNVYDFTRRVDAFSTATGNYRISVIGSFTGSYGLRYTVRDQTVGTPIRALKDPSSEYQRVLAGVTSGKSYVAFIVRPDGVEAFRSARDIATRHGLQSGWEPMTQERELVFGSGGRTIGVQ